MKFYNNNFVFQKYNTIQQYIKEIGKSTENMKNYTREELRAYDIVRNTVLDRNQNWPDARGLLMCGVIVCVIFLFAFSIFGYMCCQSARENRDEEMKSIKIEETNSKDPVWIPDMIDIIK